MWQEKALEILADPFAGDRFEEMGAFALRAAVTRHLAAAYPGAAAPLLADLRDVNLSRENLARVGQRLVSKGVIDDSTTVLKGGKYTGEDRERLAKYSGSLMASSVLHIAAFSFMESGYDVNNFWELFKEHMEPMVGPEDLEERRAAARAFEAEMKRLIEAESP